MKDEFGGFGSAGGLSRLLIRADGAPLGPPHVLRTQKQALTCDDTAADESACTPGSAWPSDSYPR